jgi:antitoxin ParD1/3/4
MNVSLTPALEKLVRQQVKSGHYNNASEVIRAALRLMKETEEFRRAKLKRLKAMLAEAEADVRAGHGTVIETEEELDAFFANL